MESGGGDKLRSSTVSPWKFKLPRKIFCDSNAFDPPFVQRKLRSAIRKRSCKSTSLLLQDSKRLNYPVNGVESLREDHCSKKPKVSKWNGCSDNSPRRVFSGPISKDEEEVVETLFALAAMVPLNDIHINKVGDESSKPKTSDLSKKHEDLVLASEVIAKEELEIACHLGFTSEGTNTTPTADGLPRDSMGAKSLIEPVYFSRSKLSEKRRVNLSVKVSGPSVKLHTVPSSLTTCDERLFANSNFFCHSTEPRLNETNQEKSLLPNGDSSINIGVVDLVPNEERQHDTSIERSKHGIESRPLHGSGVHGLPLPHSAVVFPSWLSTAISSTKPDSCKDTVTTDKVSCSLHGGRKCAAHVHISHLIQMLQISGRKEVRPLDTSHLKPSQCLNGNPVTHSPVFDSASYKNVCDTANGIHFNHRFHQVQEEKSPFSGCCGLKKQSFDFMSLSSGAAGQKDISDVNRFGNGLVSEAKGQVIYQHSVPKHSTPVTLPMPQFQFPSIGYRNHLTALSAKQRPAPPQMPPYFYNHFGQRLKWAGEQHQPSSHSHSHSRAHSRTLQQPSSDTTRSFRPISQTGRTARKQDPRSSILQMQSLLPSSRPSLEALGAKYLHVSQQQQQLIGLGRSLPSTICQDSHRRYRKNY